MRPQAFQAGEVRDEHDNIIQQGAYGKKSPFTNANNTGILDYIINNFDVVKGLLDAIEAEKLKGIATRAEAEAGAVNDKIMTPLRTRQAAEQYCLPRRGGEISGNIILNAPYFTFRSKNNYSQVTFLGGSNNKDGAFLSLNGAGHDNKGSFGLTATDSVAEYMLRGASNGRLSWGNKDVERVESKGSNYIRYASGLQICWSGEIAVTADGSYQWHYPLPFASFNYGVSVLSNNDAIRSSGWESSNVQIKVKGLTVSKAFYIILAIGLWK